MIKSVYNSNRLFLIVLFFVFFSQTSMSGCVHKQDTMQTLYSSLASVSSVYNSTYDIVTRLGADGKLSKKQKIKIKSTMYEVEKALKGASDALELYAKDSTEENKLAFYTKILIVNKLITTINNIIGDIHPNEI